MKSVLNFFFARTHSLAYGIVIGLQATLTALTGMILIPFLFTVAACTFIHLIEEVNIEVQKRSK